MKGCRRLCCWLSIAALGLAADGASPRTQTSKPFEPRSGQPGKDVAWLELHGERTMHVYYRPHAAVLGGVIRIGGRHYFLRERPWTPYYTLSVGGAWTSLEVRCMYRLRRAEVLTSRELLKRAGPHAHASPDVDRRYGEGPAGEGRMAGFLAREQQC